jgi:hypothetical protein
VLLIDQAVILFEQLVTIFEIQKILDVTLMLLIDLSAI